MPTMTIPYIIYGRWSCIYLLVTALGGVQRAVGRKLEDIYCPLPWEIYP